MLSEGIGQYIKSVSKLLSCRHIGLMKGPSQSTAILARVHSSFVGASRHGVLCGGFGTRLSQDRAPHLDAYCLFNISLVHKGWLYWHPNWCVWLWHKVGGLLLPSVAQLVLPLETSTSATSCREAQSVIFPISALFCGSSCEGKGAAKSVHSSCCAGEWHLALAFCCFLCSLAGASHLASSPQWIHSLLKRKSWHRDLWESM